MYTCVCTCSQAVGRHVGPSERRTLLGLTRTSERAGPKGRLANRGGPGLEHFFPPNLPGSLFP